MATRNIVPRADGEGEIGTSLKRWRTVHADAVDINGTDVETELAATRGRDESNARMDYTGDTNIPDGTIRWNKTNNRFEIWNAATSTWSVLSAKYMINVDTVDGYHAGNASGNVPVSNGTVNTNLDADKLDGQHASYFQAMIDQKVDEFIIPSNGATVVWHKVGELTTDIGPRQNNLTLLVSGVSDFGNNKPGVDLVQVSTRGGVSVDVYSLTTPGFRFQTYGYVNNTSTGKTEIWVKRNAYTYETHFAVLNAYGDYGGATYGNLASSSTEPSGIVYVDIKTHWTSGNDGSGSGLDADLLDGKHLSEIGGGEQWEVFPIGVPIQVWDHLSSSVVPPNSGDVIYVRLTAGQSALGGYNYGNLSSESVTGSAPLVVATAVISLSTSPLYNTTIHLINTEEAFIRARTVSGQLQNDQMQQLTGLFGRVVKEASGSGVFESESKTRVYSSGSTGYGAMINFDSSRVARSGTETRSKNVSATWYLRIR